MPCFQKKKKNENGCTITCESCGKKHKFVSQVVFSPNKDQIMFYISPPRRSTRRKLFSIFWDICVHGWRFFLCTARLTPISFFKKLLKCANDISTGNDRLLSLSLVLFCVGVDRCCVSYTCMWPFLFVYFCTVWWAEWMFYNDITTNYDITKYLTVFSCFFLPPL